MVVAILSAAALAGVGGILAWRKRRQAAVAVEQIRRSVTKRPSLASRDAQRAENTQLRVIELNAAAHEAEQTLGPDDEKTGIDERVSKRKVVMGGFV